MQKHLNEPILIIKTAWGGKSLSTDFRPPSAGAYQLPPATKKLWLKHPDGAHGIPSTSERAEWWNKKKSATGVYYRKMIEHIKYVLSDIKRVYPAYQAHQGYKLSGFVWFQGWNDMCDSTTYPGTKNSAKYALYSELMEHFIRDVRSELSVPKLPFIIGVMGVGGVQKKTNYFREAMAKPPKQP